MEQKEEKKRQNKVSSNKYQGIRYQKLSNGDIAYYARFVDNEGCNKEIKVGTKMGGWTEKKAFLKRWELKNKERHNPKKDTFKNVAFDFLDLQELHVKRKTYSSYKTYTSHINNFLGNKQVKDITLEDINYMIITLSKQKAPKTINSILNYTNAVFNFAKKQIGVENKVMTEVKKFKVNNQRERFLSLKEIELLKECIKGKEELELFVELALCTGARLMGIMSIVKKDINLEKKEVMIRDFKNDTLYIGFLSEEALQLIKNRYEKIQDEERIIPRGRRIITEHLRDILNDLFNNGVEDRKKRVVIHTLRHTFASHLAINGTPIQIIQKLLNHKDIKMTMRYAHLMPQSGREYVDKLWEQQG